MDPIDNLARLIYTLMTTSGPPDLVARIRREEDAVKAMIAASLRAAFAAPEPEPEPEDMEAYGPYREAKPPTVVGVPDHVGRRAPEGTRSGKGRMHMFQASKKQADGLKGDTYYVYPADPGWYVYRGDALGPAGSPLGEYPTIESAQADIGAGAFSIPEPVPAVEPEPEPGPVPFSFIDMPDPEPEPELEPEIEISDRLVVPRSGVAMMTPDQAVAWTVNAVAALAALPPPQDERDDVGFSGATDAPLRNYLALAQTSSVPLDYHASAHELLRQHSRTQLDRDDWEAAGRAFRSVLRTREMTDKEARKAGIKEHTRRIGSIRAGSSVRGGETTSSVNERWMLVGNDRIRVNIPSSPRLRASDFRPYMKAADLIRVHPVDIPPARGFTSAYDFRLAALPRVIAALKGINASKFERLINALEWVLGRLQADDSFGFDDESTASAASIVEMELDGEPIDIGGFLTRWRGRTIEVYSSPYAGRRDRGFSSFKSDKYGWSTRIEIDEYKHARETLESRNDEWGAWFAAAQPYYDELWSKGSELPDSLGTDSGSAAGVPYKFNEEAGRLEFLPSRIGLRGNEIQSATDGAVTWLLLDGNYTSIVQVDDRMPARLALMAERVPRLAGFVEAIQPFVEGWLGRRKTLEGTQEAGDIGGGWWRLSADRKKVYISVGVFTRAVSGGKRTSERYTWERDDSGRSYKVQVPLATGGKFPDTSSWSYAISSKPQVVARFVEKITKVNPRLAEALSRAFGGVSLAVDRKDREKCLPLFDMHRAVEPSQLTDPIAIAAVERVSKTLANRFPAGLSPFPFQMVGIAYAMLTDYRAILGDSMGLGKTIQALGCIAMDPQAMLPALIVAPKNVLFNWQDEAIKWLAKLVPADRIVVLGSGKGALGSPVPPVGFGGIAICTWAHISRYVEELENAGFNSMICDEAHYAKNAPGVTTKGGSARGRAFLRLATGIGSEDDDGVMQTEGIPRVLPLTGTPITNRIEEIWPLFKAIEPEKWGEVTVFRQQFAREIQSIRVAGEMGAFSVDRGVGVDLDNLQLLREAIACSMIRRFKKDALTFLPPKTRTTQYVRLTPDQREEYADAQDKFTAWYETRITEKLKEMGYTEDTDIDEILQEKLDTALKAEKLVQLGKLREVIGKFKVDQALVLMQEALNQNEPVIMWVAHDNVGNEIAKRLKSLRIAFGTINQRTSAQKRRDLVEAFQSGRLAVMVCSRAAREGLTMTRANRAIFVEYYWTPADMVQAEDRIWRIGQDRPCTIVRLHAAGIEIDDYMAQKLEEKQEVIDLVLGDEDIPEDERAVASDKDFANILAMIRESRGSEALEDQDIEVLAERFHQITLGLPKTAEGLKQFRLQIFDIPLEKLQQMHAESRELTRRTHAKFRGLLLAAVEQHTGRLRWIRPEYLVREDRDTRKNITIGTRVMMPKTQPQFERGLQGSVSPGAGVVTESGQANRDSAKKAVGTIKSLRVRFDPIRGN